MFLRNRSNLDKLRKLSSRIENASMLRRHFHFINNYHFQINIAYNMQCCKQNEIVSSYYFISTNVLIYTEIAISTALKHQALTSN